MKKCVICGKALGKATVKYKGLIFNAYECKKCKDKIFTEKQANEVVYKLESRRLDEEYQKKPIKIGNSWGLTFPKEVAEVFNIDSKMRFKLLPKLKKGKIEIVF